MNGTDVPRSAVTWAREHGEHYRYTCALDNYEPIARNHAYGDAWRYSNEHVADAFVIEGAMVWREGSNAIYLIDDGRTVRPYYVAAYHPEREYVIAHPFPTNMDADGNPRMRADNSRPVDFSNWMLGPRRAYHLKVTGGAS